MARESGIKSRIVREIRKTGRFAVRIAASPFQKAGLPDIFILLRKPRGRAMWMEAKRLGEKPTPIQRAVMADLINHGAAVCVVHSVEEAMNSIENWENV